MVRMTTPPVQTGQTLPDFELTGTDGETWSVAKAMGPKGLVVMFICNHCPYVKSIQERLVEDCRALQDMGVNCLAIMSNDPQEYPEDSFENMKKVAEEKGYPFPYLWDEDQSVAKAWGAVCTPDFFGLDRHGQVHYRGRLDAAGKDSDAAGLRRDLVEAMRELVETGAIRSQQWPSMGCSIKWKENARD